MEDATTGLIGLDPTTRPPEPAEQGLATRVPSLDGAVIGLISNGKGQATRFLTALYDEIGLLAHPEGKVLVEKSAVFAVPTPEDWARLTSQATVGITAFGG